MTDEQITVDVQWLGVSVTEPLVWHDLSLIKYFTPKPHPGLMGQFDVPRQHRIVPHSLAPRDGFHRITTRSLPEPWECGELSKLPYHVPRSASSPAFVITAVTGELFPGNVLVARVKARLFIDAIGKDLVDNLPMLRALRTPRATKVVETILKQVLALAAGDRSTPLSSISFDDYFIMRLHVPTSIGRELFAENREFRANAAALLVGFPESGKLGSEVVDAILQENHRLNQKAESELLLANSQGSVYVLPNVLDYQTPHIRRFEKVADLAVLALYAKEFLSDSNDLSSRASTLSEFLASKVTRLVKSPNLTFSSSFANFLTWQRISQAFQLEDHLTAWSLQHGNNEKRLGWDARVRALPAEWWQERDLERILEDDQVIAADPLAFVQPASLKSFIEADWAEAKRCLAVENYRASIVMSGAAVEGVLLAILLHDRGPAAPPNLYHMALHRLIEECCPQFNQTLSSGPTPRRLISPETASVVNFACRPWRNFIHAGVAARQAGNVTEEMARASLSALELLISQI